MIMNLQVAGAGETVLLKDLQRDFLTHNIVHVDFQRVSMTEKLEVNVPLHIVGEAPGVKLSGGILAAYLRELRVRCLPADIPDGINIDVSALQINQGVKVKDLALPKGVESLIDGGSLVVNIVAPAEEEVATPATAAPTGTEPEVIAKGKKPEEGEEGAAAPAAKGGAAPAKGACRSRRERRGQSRRAGRREEIKAGRTRCTSVLSPGSATTKRNTISRPTTSGFRRWTFWSGA